MDEHPQDQHTASGRLLIRPYRQSDEQGWLRCSALSFLGTSYFDSVFREKPQYEHAAVELVAEYDNTIVGVIDVEYESVPGSVCTVCADDSRARLGGVIWHLAVHPDFQGNGIGTGLLRAAQGLATENGITCFEVWTRDDVGTLRWYESRSFEWVKKYLHVYLQRRSEVERVMESSIPGLTPVRVFAHYTGGESDFIRGAFERVHDCNCYRLRFSPEAKHNPN